MATKTALLLLVALLAGSALLAESSRLSDEDLRAEFVKFTKQYGKLYESGEELEARFDNFKHNYEVARLRTALSGTGAQHGVTKFSDMSFEEMLRYPCGGLLNGRAFPTATSGNDAPLRVARDLPDAWDWEQNGAVTQVKDQGSCGSCWAFSTIAHLEGVNRVSGNPLISLSEQQLVDCSSTSYGCGGGWPFWALGDMMKAPYNGQIDTEDSYPYAGVGQQCRFPQTTGITVSNFTIQCNLQTAACDEEAMRGWLYTHGPLSVCFNAQSAMSYRSGIDDPTNCSPSYINHCVTIVGYGEENGVPYWRIKNSWGTNWGERGFYRMIRGKGACGVNVAVTIAQI